MPAPFTHQPTAADLAADLPRATAAEMMIANAAPGKRESDRELAGPGSETLDEYRRRVVTS